MSVEWNIEQGDGGLTDPKSTQENGLRVGDVIKDFSFFFFYSIYFIIFAAVSCNIRFTKGFIKVQN